MRHVAQDPRDDAPADDEHDATRVADLAEREGEALLDLEAPGQVAAWTAEPSARAIVEGAGE